MTESRLRPSEIDELLAGRQPAGRDDLRPLIEVMAVLHASREIEPPPPMGAALRHELRSDAAPRARSAPVRRGSPRHAAQPRHLAAVPAGRGGRRPHRRALASLGVAAAILVGLVMVLTLGGGSDESTPVADERSLGSDARSRRATSVPTLPSTSETTPESTTTAPTTTEPAPEPASEAPAEALPPEPPPPPPPDDTRRAPGRFSLSWFFERFDGTWRGAPNFGGRHDGNRYHGDGYGGQYRSGDGSGREEVPGTGGTVLATPGAGDEGTGGAGEGDGQPEVLGRSDTSTTTSVTTSRWSTTSSSSTSSTWSR